MTQKEWNKIILILWTADGGCAHNACVNNLLQQIKEELPQYEEMITSANANAVMIRTQEDGE